ncbi:UDP binding domain-containing protein [Undibacter mobilis]|uniref:UDP-glucose 6-dehydrogenase n=1 Tax=Undibacter mobilis TaxID=2292256 RepID=A0A371B6E5_9BRAD|nr:UDP binding domain-containing protein [Undibacter mobilis]RDV03156.1 UDP-glucose/GDP-mannose dehydrogenase family protein [Undibacter mobilis]
MTRPTVAFCGLTHLCICSGVAAAAKGFDVILFDPDPARVGPVADGVMPVVEPDLDMLFETHRSQITVTSDVKVLGRADVVYLAPDVPTNDRGESDLSPVMALLEIVVSAVGGSSVLVVLSQVPPGFTRSIAPKVSGPLFYQVETLVFGRAVERALYPERFIVGCFDPAAALPAPFLEFLSAFSCPILPMRMESAELAKISINLCLVASVSVANTLAELCEHIGADWSEISGSLRLDRRIGQYAYLQPGLGIAGGNLERDLATVIRYGERHGTDTSFVAAAVSNSAHRKGWPARMLEEHVFSRNPAAVIGVLGLAYKENTKSTKNSPALALVERMQTRAVRVHDPVVTARDVAPGAIAADDPIACASGVDALCIMTPWPEYRSIAPSSLAAVMRGKLVLDPYRVLDEKAAVAAGLRYMTLGAGAAAGSS